MAFSGRFLEEVKDRNDIVEFISRYVQLKRAGSNFSGLCPFHNEKTPSFTVFPGTRSFYCFGCGTGGDIFTFAMQAEGLDYPETVELLAKRA
ncbi:MAG: DNA primase, partial [Clostridia bacterium]|nr:DNA primase [Clostridia bacterium]